MRSFARGREVAPSRARTNAVGTHARCRCVLARLRARALASSACHVLLYRRTAVYLSAHAAHVPRSSCCRGRCWCSRTGLAPTRRTSIRSWRSRVREIPNPCPSRLAYVLFLRLSEWKLEQGLTRFPNHRSHVTYTVARKREREKTVH